MNWGPPLDYKNPLLSLFFSLVLYLKSSFSPTADSSIMAGGAKKPVNIFRLKDLGEPKQVFNWRLWFAVVSFGLMGAARGVDEGLISGAFNSKDFQKYIHYDTYSKIEQTNIKGNVTAMVQIGSVGGALLYV
jgi:hypothetical protein